MADIFPFKSYRKGQREAIEQAQEAFASGKRFVVIEAPTGAGKSAIAVTLARQAADAYVVTAQKILQDQYQQDFSDLSLIKGRSNYPCELNPHTTAAVAPCHLRFLLPQCQSCRYYNAKDRAVEARKTLTNYAYFLAELNHGSSFQTRDLLVLDEAHNTEAALMHYTQVRIDDQGLMRHGLGDRLLPSFAPEAETWFAYAEALLPRAKTLLQEVEKRVQQSEKPWEHSILSELQHKFWLENLVSGLERLQTSLEDNSARWVVDAQRQGTLQHVSYKPVEASPFAHDLLFSHADKVLMLSATILDPETYLRSLGIDSDEAAIISMASDFPAENRPIYVQPTAKLTVHQRERDLPKLVAKISALLEQHPHDKGLIHSHTYSIAQYIANHLPSAQQHRLITHSSGDREAALERHRNSKKPSVLLTPSMTEGIDLADALSRWQVICKIPYPYLGDPQVVARKDLDPAWYDWRTCLTVVQAYGRSVRSREDYAVTYVLDADFPKFLRRQHKRLPVWFSEAVQPLEPESSEASSQALANEVRSSQSRKRKKS